MASNAVAGVGTILSRYNVDEDIYEDIAEINSITGPDLKRDNIDVSSFDTSNGYREFIGGFAQGDTVVLSMNFTRDTYELMLEDFSDEEPQDYLITIPDGDDENEDSTIEFYGHITELPMSIPIDDKITADVTIKVTGQPAITTAFWESHLFDQGDLNLWAKGRSGLTMPDTIGSDDVNILTPTLASINGHTFTGDNTRSAEKLLDGGSYTLYFKAKQITDIANSPLFLFGNNGAAGKRGMGMYSGGQVLYIIFSDSVHYSETVQVNGIDALIKPLGWFEVYIEIDFAAKRARTKFYKNDGTVIGSSTNVNITGWTFNGDDNSDSMVFYNSRFAYADFKKFLGLKTLAQCQDNSYVTDLQIFYPTLWDGTDVSGGENHLIANALFDSDKYYSNISTYCLDYGYSVYKKLYYPDITVPNTPVGVAVARTFSGYTLVKTVAGNLTNHNLADSKLEFTGVSSANWDKSDGILFSSIVQDYNFSDVQYFRYYDAANPKRWHISELNKITMNLFYNTNHKGLTFPKITNNSINDRSILTELIGYNTDKTGSDLTKVLLYTGDDEISSDGMIFSLTVSGAPRSRTMYLKGIIGMPTVSVNWGDGTKSELLMDGTLETITHGYYADGTYQVQIQGASSLIEINMTGVAWTANASVFNAAINLEKINIQETGIKYGSISGWSSKMKEVRLWESDKGEGTTEITGSMSHMMDLEVFYNGGLNTISGNVTDKIKLKKVYFSGYSTISGDVSNCVDMEEFETSMPTTGWSMSPYITAILVTNWTKIAIICTDSKMIGDLTDAPIRYLSHGNPESAMVADVSGWVDCYELACGVGDTLSGSLTNLTKLQTYNGNGVNITKPTRLINNKALINFAANPSWVWTSAEINQLLADIWANRNEDKTNVDGFAKPIRSISIATVGSGAPTGQGIIDKESLQEYSSPTPPGTAALWTIDTN
jgi:predicted secreted protein